MENGHKTLKIFNHEVNREEFNFWVIAILFGCIISFAKIAGDDTTQTTNIEETGCWRWAVEQYSYWSSRQIINFIWAAVLLGGRGVWALYMSVSAYVLMKALRIIADDDNTGLVPLFCAALLLLFPRSILPIAGWVATTTSYFGPQAFGIMALVPLKKVLNGEEISLSRWFLYMIATIYAANAEQECVALLGVYTVATVYFLFTKRMRKAIWIQLLLLIASFIYMITCPGNWGRKGVEIQDKFPTYGMLGAIDKADIGISSTLYWFFVNSPMLIMVLCIAMCVFVWLKYDNAIYRIIASIPAISVLAMGPLRGIVAPEYPFSTALAYAIDYYGEFTVSAGGAGIGMIQFGFFLFICLCIIVEIILLNDSLDGIIADITLIIMGFGSRVMMAFSPTIYASGVRTYASLVTLLMVVVIHIFSRNVYLLNENLVKKFKYVMTTIIIIGFIDLICLVATYFY